MLMTWIRKKKSPYLFIFFEFVLLTLGCLIAALSFNTLLLPNQIASGGVTGLSVLLKDTLSIEPAYTQLALHLILLIIGSIVLGKSFGVRTAYASVILPILVFLTKDFPALSSDPLLASIFGGLGLGLGVGITFLAKGSTGGFSVLARIIHKYSGISLGKCSMMIDAIIILGSAFVFGTEKAFLALIGAFLTSRAVDFMQTGFKMSKITFIISEHSEEIKSSVLTEMERGATILPGYGGYTNQRINMLIIVVGQWEVLKLKEIIKKSDPDAFTAMWDTYEVFGHGFHLF